MTNKVGIDESSVIKFIENVLKSNGSFHLSHISLNDESHLNAVNDKIKDLKILYSRPNGYKRNYQVIKMMSAVNTHKIKQKIERNVSLQNILGLGIAINYGSPIILAYTWEIQKRQFIYP